MQEQDSRRVPPRHKLGQIGFSSAGPVLKQMVPELVVSKQKLQQAKGSCLVRIKREEQNQTSAFSSRPFVLCGLPVRSHPRADCCSSEEMEASFFRSPDILSSACPSVSTSRAHLPGDSGCPAKEPNRSFQERFRNAGDVRDAEGGQGIQAAGGSIREYLRRGPFSLGPIRWPARPSWYNSLASTFYRKPKSGTTAISTSAPFQ